MCEVYKSRVTQTENHNGLNSRDGYKIFCFVFIIYLFLKHADKIYLNVNAC